MTTIRARDPVFITGVLTCALVLAVWLLLMVLGAIRGREISAAQASLDTFDQKLNSDPSLKQAYQTYVALESVANQLTGLRQARVLFLPTWKKIKSSVPKDVKLTSVMMSEGNQFLVSGRAASLGSVAAFVTALDSAGNFDSSQTQNIAYQEETKEYTFTLSFASVIPPRAGAS